MCDFPALESGKRPDGSSGFFLGEAQLVDALQVEPKFSARAPKMGKAKSGVASNGARAVQNLRSLRPECPRYSMPSLMMSVQ
jgi:hypothetical protein